METKKLKIVHFFIILFLINIFIFTFFYGKTSLFSDISRELYIPMAMNNGDILYKDIFNVYAPLGYQINSFFTSIFGVNIKTFSIIGLLNSTIILFGIYIILRIFIKNQIYILSILTLIISCCFYTVSQTNYIIPYSYSLIFSLNFFIWGLTSLLYFYKKEKNKFLYFSWILYGASIACKYEFAPFIIMLIGTHIDKKIPIKTTIKCLLCMAIVPLLSLIELLIKGVNYNDIKQSVIYILELSKAESVTTLYKYLGFIPTLNTINETLNYLYKFITCILCFISIPILCRNKTRQFYTASIISFIITLYVLYPIFVESNAFYFNWIGLLSIILFIIFIKKIYSDKMLLILCLTSLLCSYKCIFKISFNSYGTYYFPLLFAIIGILIYLKLTEKKWDIGIKITTVTFFCLTSLYLLSNTHRSNISYTGLIEFNNKLVFTEQEQAEPIRETINWLNTNSKRNDTILVLPEGAVINVLTKRKSHNKFYYLIPPNIEIFGEDNIVKELKENLPEYLVIQPMSYTNFNETFFCESFGQKICGLIPKYYESPIVFGDNFWLAVYKKKEINEK